MPSSKTKTAANATETVGLSVNETILKDCHKLYVDEEKGS